GAGWDGGLPPEKSSRNADPAARPMPVTAMRRSSQAAMARPRWMKLQLAMRASIGGRGRAEAAAGRMSVVTKSPEQEGTGAESAGGLAREYGPGSRSVTGRTRSRGKK